ncbi:hypothetical protein TRIP_B300024 [uncultured Desulfatiglans sp.]|nr:hypothetical protein TRIP_B300024 [uncultured Desulfatiglans sp.]
MKMLKNLHTKDGVLSDSARGGGIALPQWLRAKAAPLSQVRRINDQEKKWTTHILNDGNHVQPVVQLNSVLYIRKTITILYLEII